MVSTGQHHVDELLESIGPKEWVRGEMAGLRDDFAAFAKFRDQLLATHRGDWAAVYKGELICVARGPVEVYAELRRRQIPIWRPVIRLVAPDGSINPLLE